MTTDAPLITCIARMAPKPGKEAAVLEARARMLADFAQIDGFVSATLYRVTETGGPGEVGEWRDIVVFSSPEALAKTSESAGYRDWSDLTDFLGYEYVELVD